MNKKRVILIGIVVLFIAGMALYPTISRYFLVNKTVAEEAEIARNPSVPSSRPLNVNAQILKHENLNETYRTIGSLIPDEDVDLSFETSGKITEIYFKEGSQVKKGELLAKVNDKPLLAELKKLEAQIPLAEDRVYRQEALLAKDAVSKEAYEQVTTELEKLNADIELMKARIAQTELRAPFDGVIGLRLVSEGAYASPTTVIAYLTKTIPLKVEFSFNERYVNQIGQGTNIRFTVPDDQLTYYASIYAIESRVDLETRTQKARAVYPNTNGRLKPGGSAAVEITLLEIKDALTVPSQAIIAEMGRDIAYVYRGGKAQQVMLEKGIRTEDKVQVLSGLVAGDTLITTGVMQLRDGMPITIDNLLQ